MSEVEEREDVQTPEEELSETDSEMPEESDRRNADSLDSEEGGEDKKLDPQNLAKRLRDTQDALRQKSEELARMRERLAVLESKVEPKQQQSSQPEGPKPFSYLFDEGVKDTLYDDPENVLNILRQTVSDIVTLLETRDAALTERISKNSPEYQEIKDQVERLAKIPEFAGLGADVLQRIARGMMRMNNPDDRGESGAARIRPGPSGRKGAARGAGKNEVDRLADEFYRKIYGG